MLVAFVTLREGFQEGRDLTQALKESCRQAFQSKFGTFVLHIFVSFFCFCLFIVAVFFVVIFLFLFCFLFFCFLFQLKLVLYSSYVNLANLVSVTCH